MIIRSKAPLRIGLAGGGSDVRPYCDLYGGLALNATISLYTYCTIEETTTGKIEIAATDLDKSEVYSSAEELPITGCLDLQKGVYNRIIKEYSLEPSSFKMVTHSDVPSGSGLGSSSTLVVCILQAFNKWLHLSLKPSEIASLAYEIEREDLGFAGGKQDQYSAAFGGFNFIKFPKGKTVKITKLKLNPQFVDELESSLLLYYTEKPRISAKIIKEQARNISNAKRSSIEATHMVKQSANDMKLALLKSDMRQFADLIKIQWEHKKKMADGISNDIIQTTINSALSAGAYAGKASGAGGGGFIVFVIDPLKRRQISNALMRLGGKVYNFHFTNNGVFAWRSKK
jgi:D-glycero-alpha-D-manno-heptose-7-phosphate kinase